MGAAHSRVGRGPWPDPGSSQTHPTCPFPSPPFGLTSESGDGPHLVVDVRGGSGGVL